MSRRYAASLAERGVGVLRFALSDAAPECDPGGGSDTGTLAFDREESNHNANLLLRP